MAGTLLYKALHAINPIKLMSNNSLLFLTNLKWSKFELKLSLLLSEIKLAK